MYIYLRSYPCEVMSILQLDSRLELTQFQWLANCGSDKVVAYLSKIAIVLEKYKRTKSLLIKKKFKNGRMCQTDPS